MHKTSLFVQDTAIARPNPGIQAFSDHEGRHLSAGPVTDRVSGLDWAQLPTWPRPHPYRLGTSYYAQALLTTETQLFSIRQAPWARMSRAHDALPWVGRPQISISGKEIG